MKNNIKRWTERKAIAGERETERENKAANQSMIRPGEFWCKLLLLSPAGEEREKQSEIECESMQKER